MNDLDTASDVLQLFGEPSRLRLLSLLGAYELTVSELVAITGLSQSRVSTHLSKLRRGGLLRDRSVGTWTYYRLSRRIEPATERLWRLLSEDIADSQLAQDSKRAERAISARAAGERWPEQVAGTMERHYSPGRTWEATCRAFTTLLSLGDVLDIGSGDGALAELLAPRARSLTCVDASPRVSAAAARRLAGHEHTRALCADMHALPLGDASFDQVLMLNVLTFSESPGDALAEAARTLRAGGRVTVITLARHRHQDVASTYGHVVAGFTPTAVTKMLVEAGLEVESCGVTSREQKRPNFEVLTAVAVRTEASMAGRKQHTTPPRARKRARKGRGR